MLKIPLSTRLRIPPFTVTVGVVWLAVVFWSTLRPLTGLRLARHVAVPVTCVLCGSGGLTDIILNLILFLPLGVVACALGWNWRRSAVSLALLTLAIETSQYFWLPGRDASLGDVLANTAGGLMGFLLAHQLRRASARGEHRSHRTPLVLLALHLLTWFGTAALIRPSISGHLPWHGGKLGNSLPLATVHNAMLGGTSFGNDSSAIFLPAHTADTLTLSLTQHSAAPDLKRLVILRLRDANHSDLVMVDQGPEHLTLGLRLNASVLRLRTPGWSAATPGRLPVGVPTQLQWSWREQGVTLQFHPATSDSITATTVIPFSVTLGWSFIHPFVSDISESAKWWSALWVVWWFGVLGWSTRRMERGWVLGYGAGAILILLAAGWLVGWPVAMMEVMAGAVGFAVGQRLEVRGQRRERSRGMTGVPSP